MSVTDAWFSSLSPGEGSGLAPPTGQNQQAAPMGQVTQVSAWGTIGLP